MKTFLREFKKFIMRGNVIDMSVGVIVGSAFTAIVNELTDHILRPVINWLLVSILGSDKESEMPFVELFIKDVKVSKIIDVITLFSILTTYASSLYGSYAIAGKSVKFRWKALLFLASLLVSNLGFSKIVDTIYPLIGIIGFLLLLIICSLSKFFQVKRREHTLRPLKYKE